MTRTDPNPDDHVQTVRSAVGIADATWRSRFDLVGPDRKKFLEGQCTQHIGTRSPGQGGYAFVLEPKGAAVTDLDFLILEDRIEIEIPECRKAELAAWFGKFLLLSDAELVDRDEDSAGLLLIGPQADQRLGLLNTSIGEGDGALVTVAGTEITARRDLVCGVPGWSLRLPADARDAIVDALEAPVVSAEAVDLLRTEAGRPRFGAELDPGVLPKESGQEARAVSYDKGCYCGQEVVARQHFLGNPRKTLVGLLPQTPGARAGDDVTFDGKVIGTLGTVHRSPTLGRDIALCMLKGADHAVGAVRMIEPSEGEPITAEVAGLPFVT